MDANNNNDNMDSSVDWRTQLEPNFRQRIIEKLLGTLKRLFSASPEELVGVASKFEEKIYSVSANKHDYLRKISLKMMALESKSLNGADNSIPSNYVGNQNPSDPAIQGLHSQLCNPGQSLPMGNQSQPRQQLLPQNLQNAIASSSVQSSSSLQTALSSMTGLSQTAMSNVVSQNSNLQAMSGISQNSINKSVGQGVPSNMFSNAQRHMQGRQHSQQVLSQQQQQQSQNPQQFYQHHTMNQKLQQGIMQPPLLQSCMHQHPSLLQPNQMQPSQQSLMQMSSTLQSSQATFTQIQPSMVQSAPQSSLIQNHQSSVQQPRPSGLQQHQQSVLRQQQTHQPSVHQQTSVLHQQQTPINQQPMLSSQQQQQLVAQEYSTTNMQQNQLLAQQNSVLDMKHQQHQQKMMLSQQNNLSNVQQQQLFSQQNKNLHQQQQLSQQSNFSGQQQQQQHLIGSQPCLGASSMQQHQHPDNILQQTKGAAQHQPQQTSSTLLPSQGQQSQSQPVQQLSSQSQPVQLQQQQHTLQQRIQTSASLDSTAQAGQPGATDLQEEMYQKIKSMKQLYLPELTELHQKITMRCQQLEALPQHPKQTDAFEKLKSFKISLDRMISFLQFPKSSILPTYKEKLPQLEKQIINYLAKNGYTKPAASQQPGHQQLQQSVGQPHLLMQQPQSQIHQLQQQENQVNPMQPMSMQDSMTSMQSTAVSSLQSGSMPLSNYMGVPATQQNMINSLQTSSNLESTLGHTLRSLPQGALGSLQQNTINAPQKTNTGTLSHSTVNQLQPSVNSLPLNSSILQQHLKQQQQEHQLMQSQQLKQQYQQQQQCHLFQFTQQQHKQQVFQRQQQPQMQQQFQQQQLYQQQKQLQAQQIPQLHQMNEVNELKVRPGAGIKSELFPQPHHAGQRQTTYQQQLKTGSPFSVSSPQLLQAASPQLSQHSSPQIDQQNLHTAPSKVGTPLQSANSPLIGTSPSSPSAPSPIPGDSEKQSCFISSTPNAGNTGHQQAAHGPTQAQSFSIGTPGISASPLLAEFTSLDGNQGNVPSHLSGKSSTMEQPLERLIKVVRSISLKAFSSSVIDIGSVASMIDTIAGSAPGNGSRAAAGEDLVAMTKCHLQARNFISHDGSCTTKKKRLRASVMPLHVVSSACSANDSFESDLENSELVSTATTRIRRHRADVNNTLLQEVREINQQLIDTNIEISDEDVDLIAAAAEGEGTIVKCSFNALAATSNLKSQYASAQIIPILPLRLFVPANYPNCSPIILDKLPKEPSEEFEDLSVKVRLRFSISLRGLLQPMSLEEMTQTWDDCARMVIAEYAQQSGGGSFSSRYGTWENCVRA